MCPSGYQGDPNDLTSGCKLRGQCTNDIDCLSSEICFQIGKGSRKCVDACTKLQCGPNALCLANDHRSTCICAEGYFGNPGDLNIGCQVDRSITVPDACNKDNDCPNENICSITDGGLKKCVHPCSIVACGNNEACVLDDKNNAICQCKDSYAWNPLSSSCEKPSIPDCTNDEQCHQVAACKPDVLGVLKCVSVCSEFTCAPNSVCVASNHRGSCQCLPGYIGNPNDRNGCKPEQQNKCVSNAECAENEECLQYAGYLTCRSSCENVKCGPHAVCISNNHQAQCQCPTGAYAGDPYNLETGCKAVPCVYNIDCPPTQLCNRLTHTCDDICTEDTCGTNAICIAEDHHSNCQCPPRYKPNPIADVECILVESCNPNPCHPTAICETGVNGPICRCPQNYIGDPQSSGCLPEGNCPNGDRDCPENTVCLANKCVDPCESACGINTNCQVVNGKPICTCMNKFVASINGNARDGCVRTSTSCTSDYECDGDACHNGQCKAPCRNNGDCSVGEKCLNNICTLPCSSHSQCQDGQSCVKGTCSLGCRSNKECTSEAACINSKCQNPCAVDAVCGPNAICSAGNHETTCTCPPGFEGNPIPDQGCVRVPKYCATTRDCPSNHMCIANQCNYPCTETKACAVGERCSNNVCAKVCYSNNNCLPGEICESGTCQSGCESDVDCQTDNQVCFNGKCKCRLGFINTPFGCNDIDECTEQPCHPSAECENTPGSFRCVCSAGKVGDAYAQPGCLSPNECYKHEDCANNLACSNGKCTDPCHLENCGLNALCQVHDREAICTCPPGHLGDPKDVSLGCYRVECLTNDDCTVDRHCHTEANRCISKYQA
jgi:hypothetical protein